MSDGFAFGEKMLLKTGFIASDAPTEHPDPRMHWKLADMAQFYNPPLIKQTMPIELVYESRLRQ